MERVVIERAIGLIEGGVLMPRLLSAYRRHHSTEIALLKVLSDILGAIDRKQVTLLGLRSISVQPLIVLIMNSFYGAYSTNSASRGRRSAGYRNFLLTIQI